MDEIEELTRKVNPGNSGCLCSSSFMLLNAKLNSIVFIAGKPNSPGKCRTV